MKSVALHNLGCKVNGYEMEVIRQNLQESGYRIVSFDDFADIYIVNTCTVTNIADKKSRQMLHKAKKKNPHAIVVAAGCYVQAGREEVLKDSAIDLAVGNNKKGNLIKILEEFIRQREAANRSSETVSWTVKDKTMWGMSAVDLSVEASYENMRLYSAGDHTRAFIKIQDGCSQFCSYCIIPYARGRIRSRDREDILKEVRGLSERGYREVILTGIHLSSYGLSPGENQNFEASGRALIRLVKEIGEISGIERIRFGSLEPRIISEEFVRELSGMRKVCPHFHLSLQSGCDDTLKRMNRHYTAGEYFQKVQILRRYYQDPGITTDIIVGFPGETEEEYEATCDFVKKVSFSEIHVFKYSRRKGTAASRMEGQIPERVKGERSSGLIALGEELSRKYREGFLHREVELLCEEYKVIDGAPCYVGYTREYIRGAVPAAGQEPGMPVRGQCTGMLTAEPLIMVLSLAPKD